MIRWLHWRLCYGIVWCRTVPTIVWIAWRLAFVWNIVDYELFDALAKRHYPKEFRKMKAAGRFLVRKFPEYYYHDA